MLIKGKMGICSFLIIFNLLVSFYGHFMHAHDTCHASGVCNASWETEGDITIGIISNFHRGTMVNNQYRHCSLFQPQAFELVEVIRWVFDQMQQKNYIPGIKIGK